MLYRFARTERLIGSKAMDTLRHKKIAIFGIGGVGSYAVEALARSGVGALVLIDGDVISESNINRQLHALTSTIGISKVDAMKTRVQDINPDAEVLAERVFYLPGVDGLQWDYDYVVDAMDTVTAKLQVVQEANERAIPVISCMGTGNKLDPSRFEVDDIYRTSVCPLAKVMRRELKKRNIDALKVVFSREIPIEPDHTSTVRLQDATYLQDAEQKGTTGRPAPASISFVPPVAGLMMAGEVIKDLMGL